MPPLGQIAASQSATTRPTVTTAIAELESAGYRVTVFTDADAMGECISSGAVAGVLDLDLSAVARATLADQPTPSLAATADRSLPSVVAPGGLGHLTPAQAGRVATRVAEHLNHYPFPPTVALPLGSAPAGVDQPLFAALRQRLNPDITVLESDLAFDHPGFARLCARNLLDDLNS